jgi:iron only hydrogenase large subunit-like protein
LFEPIYTEPKQCQDCYKCVRSCPIKSIRFADEQKAYIIPDSCIFCGHCVDVCPVKAKKVRSDIARVKLWMERGHRVIAALAPSIMADFSDIPYENLLAGIKELGFSAVVEVSSGAHEVTNEIKDWLHRSPQSIAISTACPSVVFMIQMYYPQLVSCLAPVMSPALATAGMIKKSEGADVKVVFIGPCISKMKEADQNPGLIDAVLNFIDLRELMNAARIDPQNITLQPGFLLHPQGHGRLYPIDGGMNDALKKCGLDQNVNLLSFSGPHRVKSILESLDTQQDHEQRVFLELLACEGGCLMGPMNGNKSDLVKKILQQKKQSQQYISSARTLINGAAIDCAMSLTPATINQPKFTESEIRATLAGIGKERFDDELNCNGCGHETCRDFAISMLLGKSHPSMCVSYMRKLATNKANALIKAIPAGIVIVDNSLNVLEHNARFAALLDSDYQQIFEVTGSLTAFTLEQLLPFHGLFAASLHTNEEIVEKEIEYRNRILMVSVFTIEKGRVAGGVIQDVTEPYVEREQIVKKAQEVIHKNLSTVQKIAYLLGENAAESEVLLNSIIKSYSAREEGHDPFTLHRSGQPSN